MHVRIFEVSNIGSENLDCGMTDLTQRTSFVDMGFSYSALCAKFVAKNVFTSEYTTTRHEYTDTNALPLSSFSSSTAYVLRNSEKAPSLFTNSEYVPH